MTPIQQCPHCLSAVLAFLDGTYRCDCGRTAGKIPGGWKRGNYCRVATVHNLKTWPRFFDMTLHGLKPFEIRTAHDRDFRVGDVLRLVEWDPRRNPADEVARMAGKGVTKARLQIMDDLHDRIASGLDGAPTGRTQRVEVLSVQIVTGQLWWPSPDDHEVGPPLEMKGRLAIMGTRKRSPIGVPMETTQATTTEKNG